MTREIESVRHTIYAYDTTVWYPGGSDAHIEGKLQEAVNAIGDKLDDSGLICSPSKSELPVIPPKRANRGTYKPIEYQKIKVGTMGGQVIPEVAKIRVLGTGIEKQQINSDTFAGLTTKVPNAMRLIKKVTNRN